MLPKLPAFQTWATGSFGAGAFPWSSALKRQTPASDGFEPDAIIPARGLNDVLAATKDEGNALIGVLGSWLGPMQALNFKPVTLLAAVGSGANYLRRVRHRFPRQFNQRIGGALWAVVSDSAAGAADCYLAESRDNGHIWTYVNAGAAIATNNAKPGVFVVDVYGQPCFNLGTTKIRKYDLSTGATFDSGDEPVAGVSVDWSCMEPYYSAAAFGSAKFRCMALGWGGGANRSINWFDFSNLVSGSFANTSANIPAALQAVDTSAAGAGWVFAEKVVGLNTTWVAFTRLTGQANYMRSTDQMNTAASLETSPVAAGETVKAVTYSHTSGVFILLTNTATDSKIYTSETGSGGTWTLFTTLTSHLLSSLEVCGEMMLAAEQGTGNTHLTEPNQTWFCSLAAGSGFIRAPLCLPWNGLSTADARYTAPQVTAVKTPSGAYQFFAYSMSGVYIGLTLGTPIPPL